MPLSDGLNNFGGGVSKPTSEQIEASISGVTPDVDAVIEAMLVAGQITLPPGRYLTDVDGAILSSPKYTYLQEI